MALARVTTWSSGQVLTASALNGEFDSILNNALSLVFPLTGNADLNGYSLLNLAIGTVGAPALSFNGDSDTGLYRAGANRLGIAAGGVSVADFGATASTTGIVPPPVNGTPNQHALFRENVIKGWIQITVTTGTPSIADSFNVTSITDNGAGDFTITWDRDFASAAYAVAGMQRTTASNNMHVEMIADPTAGATRIGVIAATTDTLTDPGFCTCIAIGDQ